MPPFTNGFHVRVAVVFGLIGIFFLSHGVQTLLDAARRGEMITAFAFGAAFVTLALLSIRTLLKRRHPWRS